MRRNPFGKTPSGKQTENINKHMKFTNKETYLAYRSNWKAQYKAQSKLIRNAKFCNWFESLRREDRIAAAQARYDSISPKPNIPVYYMYREKKKATAMLAELKEAKQEAQRQYLAAKAEKQELVTA